MKRGVVSKKSVCLYIVGGKHEIIASFLHAVEELAWKGSAEVALPWQALRFGLRLEGCASRRTVAGLVGEHAAVAEDEAGHALRREVVDEVLHPGEVGVKGSGIIY